MTHLACFSTILTVCGDDSFSFSAVLHQHLLLWKKQGITSQPQLTCTHFLQFNNNDKHQTRWCHLCLTSGPTLWMMRSFFGIGALDESSWFVSVSVTAVVLSSSSRGLFDMVEVPGVAETRNDEHCYIFFFFFNFFINSQLLMTNWYQTYTFLFLF